MATSAAAVEYCREVLRRHDRDRYLASLFAPDDLRPHLWGLYAFSYEIARIRDLVSEPAPAEIRLSWWTEVIEAIYAGSAADHPVAQPLARAIDAGHLPKQAFLDLIEARRFDQYSDPMPSLGDLEGYLGETSSTVIQLASMILQRTDAPGVAAAAGFAGVAYGLVGILRSLPFHRARGQCFVPGDILARHGLEPKHLLQGEPDRRLGDALTELRMIAIRRLGEARNLKHQVPSAALPAFLPVALLEAYLVKLAKAGTDALSTVADIPHLMRIIRLWRAARNGRF